eukprot:5475204-Alexandrium_andersonii.AAC.1
MSRGLPVGEPLLASDKCIAALLAAACGFQRFPAVPCALLRGGYTPREAPPARRRRFSRGPGVR